MNALGDDVFICLVSHPSSFSFMSDFMTLDVNLQSKLNVNDPDYMSYMCVCVCYDRLRFNK